MLPHFMCLYLSAEFSHAQLNLLFQVILVSLLPSNKRPSPGDLLLSYWPGQMVLLEKCQHPTKEPIMGREDWEGLMTIACVICILAPQNYCGGKASVKLAF